jgi:hypothetical protein
MTHASATGIGHNNPPSDMEIVLARLSDHERTIRERMSFPAAPSVIAEEREAGRVTDTIKGIKGLIKKVSDTHKAVKDPYLECGRAVDAWKKKLEGELEVISVGFTGPLNAFLEKRAQEERHRQIEAARAERERAEALAAEAQAHAEAGIDDTANELMDAAISTEIMAERMEDKVHLATPSQLARARSLHGASASQKLVWAGEIKNISAIDLNQLRSHFTVDAIQKAINAFVRDGGRQLDGVLIEQRTQLAIR